MSAYNAGAPHCIPGSGRSPGEGNGNPVQYSCLENPMDGGVWWATSPKGRKESDTTEGLHFLSQCATTTESVLKSRGAAAAEPKCPRDCAPQEKPPQ